MIWNRNLTAILLGMLICSATCLAWGGHSTVPREDRAWKLYANAKAGYCVSYPRRWHRGDAFDGAGIYAAAIPKNSPFPVGAIDITAFPDAAPALKPISLNSDVEAHMDGLRRFVRAQQTEILEQHSFSVAGNEGLFLKARYFDPREKSLWVEEVIFARRNGMLYRMEMQTRDTQLARFEPVFTRFVNSFEFNCHDGRR